ncbi:MAG: tRNA (guanosine(37)-N1)-methyltransferase TrmD [Alcanivoracaceae bacterium]
MDIAVVTLFPDMLAAIKDFGVTGRAVSDGRLTLTAVNPRDFTHDVHRTVDDRPFGGGPGMVMKAEPLAQSVAAARRQVAGKVIYLSPQGQPLTQEKVSELAGEPGLVLVAGRYEGVDERFIEACVDEEISIGDYVLSGGELPAMVLIDAVARYIPGVLGHEDSARQDSFSGENSNLLDCPHYTRPEVFEGRAVPDVLRSGNHAAIDRWRLQQALGRTAERRPDLLAKRRQQQGLDDEQETLLAAYHSDRNQRSDSE